MRFLWLGLAAALWAQQDAATRALLLKYDATFWWLNLTVSHTSTQLGPSWVLTRLRVTAPALDTLVFELHSALTVDSVVVQGIRRSFIRRGSTVRIPLNPQPPQGTELEALVYYRGTPPSSGKHRHLQPVVALLGQPSHLDPHPAFLCPHLVAL
ncbi:MAG: hypothetical protein KatS3mg026_1502 [Bacteroidia bacterium]|nr:MAG: hypothetical protein KatS3mg026_1502 [Bacteroidia bacterium]